MIAREPQGPIQKNPAGLLSFLGIKGTGETPNSLDGKITPIIDVQQFFLANATQCLQEDLFTGPGGTGGALITFFIVPTGKIWFVRKLSVVFQIDGNTTSFPGASIWYNPPGFGSIDISWWSASQVAVAPVAGRTVYAEQRIREDWLILRPFDQIRVAALGWVLSGANVGAAQLVMEYVELQV